MVTNVCFGKNDRIPKSDFLYIVQSIEATESNRQSALGKGSFSFKYYTTAYQKDQDKGKIIYYQNMSNRHENLLRSNIFKIVSGFNSLWFATPLKIFFNVFILLWMTQGAR